MLCLVMVGLLGGCTGEKEEVVDEFGLPEVEFGKLAAEVRATALSTDGKSSVPDDDPDELHTNIYVVPPGFLSSPVGEKTSAGPFAEDNRRTAKEVLESYGVVFGPGAAVITGGATSQLIVRQTAEQMRLVEGIIQSLKMSDWSQQTINLRIEVYELSAAQAMSFLEESESKADHSAEWAKLLQLRNMGSVRFVTNAMILSRSRQRAKYSDVKEVLYVTDFDWQNPGKSKEISPVFQTREVGTILAVDPTLNKDGQIVDLAFAFEHHSAAPEQKKVKVAIPGTDQTMEVTTPVFHAKKITSKLSLADGAVRIIGVWRPTGKPEFETEDLMHIAFLKMDLQPVFPNENEP